MLRYEEHLQAIVSCVTVDIVRTEERFRPPGPPGAFVLARGLPSRMGRLALTMYEWFQIGTVMTTGRNRFEVVITGYTYAIRDESEQEIIAWHWHPERAHTAPHPHLHIGAGALVRREELYRAHLPTGIVTVADVVHSANTDFHVEPRRDDWQTILSAADF